MSFSIDKVTIPELAQSMGRTVRTIQLWIADGVLPAPIEIVRGNRFWRRETIEAWPQERAECAKNSKV